MGLKWEVLFPVHHKNLVNPHMDKSKATPSSLLLLYPLATLKASLAFLHTPYTLLVNKDNNGHKQTYYRPFSS